MSFTTELGEETPVTENDLSPFSLTPRRIMPPLVFAKAEYVSHMLFGARLEASLHSKE